MNKVSDKDVEALKSVWKSFKKIHFQVDYCPEANRAQLGRLVNTAILYLNTVLPDDDWDGEREVFFEIQAKMAAKQMTETVQQDQLIDAIKFCQFRDEYKRLEILHAAEKMKEVGVFSWIAISDELIYIKYLGSKKWPPEEHNSRMLHLFSEDH